VAALLDGVNQNDIELIVFDSFDLPLCVRKASSRSAPQTMRSYWPLLPFPLAPLPQLRMPRPFNILLFPLIVELRMNKAAALGCGFLFLDLDAVLISPDVLTYAGYLPRDLDAGLIGLDGEALIRDFVGDDGLRELSNDG
jgi:hypothetical protein